MEESKILITAATGNVGTPLVKKLQEKDVLFTAGTRNSVAAKEKLGTPLETVYMDFKDVASFVPAIKGKDIVFLCGPSATPGAEKLLMPVIEEAQRQKVKHIVFIASYPSVMEAIKNTGIDYTFIQANFFMQNFEMYQTEDIRDKNQIFLPVGDGKAPFIHARDIGEVAAEIINRPDQFKNQTIQITGPETLDHFEVAEIFSNVLGKKITFKNPSDEEYRKEMKERGFSKEYIDAMIAVFGKIKQRKIMEPTDEVEKILGRKPIALKQYVEEKKAHFS